MASAPRLPRALDIGRRTLQAAAAVNGSLFPRWRQRAFRRHLGRFIVALQQIGQPEAVRLTAADLTALTDLVNRIQAHADAFMAEHYDVTTAEVEQDRFVVTEIYELRAIAETLARHVTPNPAFTDVAFALRTENANRPRK